MCHEPEPRPGSKAEQPDLKLSTDHPRLQRLISQTPFVKLQDVQRPAFLDNMASSGPRKPPTSTQAEVALLPSLKNCLLNLPSTLVNALLNSNAVVQNVVVELSFRAAPGSDGKPEKQQSVFLGWTGMRSQTRRTGPRGDAEVAAVEVDGTFGRLIGLREGMKVRHFPSLLASSVSSHQSPND